MCEIIIDGKTVELEGSTLTAQALHPYRKTAKYVKIRESVTEIESWAFRSSKLLESVEIPDSVVSIGNFIFFGCNNVRVDVKKELLPVLISNRALEGRNGQIITVAVDDEEYSLLNYYRRDSGGVVERLVITGYVDYAGGKLYSGYKFVGNLEPSTKESMYYYISRNTVFYDITLSDLKRRLEEAGIR